MSRTSSVHQPKTPSRGALPSGVVQTKRIVGSGNAPARTTGAVRRGSLAQELLTSAQPNKQIVEIANIGTAQLAIFLDKVAGSPIEKREVMRAIAEKVGRASATDDPVTELAKPDDPAALAAGWDRLLQKGAAHRTQLLQSKDFTSVAKAAAALGIAEHGVRKRIREKRLFALQKPGGTEYRVPVWALDVSPTDTLAVMQVPGAEPWRLWHFLTTPNGPLNGLRPFELLLPATLLDAAQRADLEELLEDLGPRAKSKLVDIVIEALKADLSNSE